MTIPQMAQVNFKKKPCSNQHNELSADYRSIIITLYIIYHIYCYYGPRTILFLVFLSRPLWHCSRDCVPFTLVHIHTDFKSSGVCCGWEAYWSHGVRVPCPYISQCSVDFIAPIDSLFLCVCRKHMSEEKNIIFLYIIKRLAIQLIS